MNEIYSSVVDYFSCKGTFMGWWRKTRRIRLDCTMFDMLFFNYQDCAIKQFLHMIFFSLLFHYFGCIIYCVKLKYAVPRLTEVTVIHSRCNITRLENSLVCNIHSVHILRNCVLKSLLRSIDRLELSKKQRETRARSIKYASNESLYLL